MTITLTHSAACQRLKPGLCAGALRLVPTRPPQLLDAVLMRHRRHFQLRATFLRLLLPLFEGGDLLQVPGLRRFQHLDVAL